MKKSITHFLLLFLCVMSIVPGVGAQSLLDKTYFTPYNPQTSVQNVNLNIGNGSTFIGTKKTTTNAGQVIGTYYYGTIRRSNGDRLMSVDNVSSFDGNLNCTNGSYFLIKNNGEVYKLVYNNGYCTSESRYTGNYTINNNCFVAQTQSSNNSGYYYTNPYANSTNPCGVCSSTGRCLQCNGTGKSPNHAPGIIANCGYCGGTGLCGTCGGRGYN